MTVDTAYINTDFDLLSLTPFKQLHHELSISCAVLNYWQNETGLWTLSLESNQENNTNNAAVDIEAIINALNQLSSSAKAELAKCHLKEFNIGFNCGDTWAYVHKLPADIIKQISTLNCTIAITLYPTDNSPD